MKLQHIIATIIFLVSATWVVTWSERTVRSIQATYFQAIAPFATSGSNLENKVRHFLSEVKTSRQLEKRLVAIEGEFGKLQATEARYKQIETENKRLRYALDFKERSKFDLVAAKILKREPASWWKTIKVNKGENGRIATQLPVISEKGLVGKIDLVSSDTSTVLLITDESCLVSARVADTPWFGIISGRRAEYGEEALLILNYISNDISVEPGARVITSGKGGVFPDNIEIGTIVSIENGPLYAKALVKPTFSLDETEVVFTVTKTKHD